MHELITMHPALCAVVAYWIFSALVFGMPEPSQGAHPGYLWTYNSLHLLAGNLTAAVSARYPQMVQVPPGAQIEHKETTTVTAPPTGIR